MTADEVRQYIEEHVPNFINVKLRGPGVAYHYTPHADAIIAASRFLGAPLTVDLDRTQQEQANSPVAIHDPGVVFAYEDVEEARGEGAGLDVLEITYSAAVEALHEQEAWLEAPPTILIVSTDIIAFKKV